MGGDLSGIAALPTGTLFLVYSDVCMDKGMCKIQTTE